MGAACQSLGAQAPVVPWWKIVPVVPRRVVKNSPPVVVCVNKWEDFVHATGVGSMDVHKYYLGRSAPSRRGVVFGDRSIFGVADVSNVDYERIISGLFADAVEVGTLVLPVGYNGDDFSFEVVTNRDGGPVYERAGYRRVVVSFQNDGKHGERLAYAQMCVEKNVKMGSLYDGATTLEWFSSAVDDLIASLNN